MKKFKARNILFLGIAVLCFPIMVSAGLSAFAAILTAVIVAGPIYFLFFVLKLPAWLRSKMRKDTEKIRQSRNEALNTAREIAQEGIVLLKNEEDLLPLIPSVKENQKKRETVKLNVFGRCSIQTFYNGSGSAASDIKKCVPLISALKEFGEFELNQDLLNLQKNYIKSKKISISGKGKDEVGEVKVNKGGAEFLGKRPDLILQEIPKEIFEAEVLYEDGRSVMEHARDFSEYALVTVGRGGAEGFELKAGDLQLSVDEQELLKVVCQHFDKVILVLNTSNPLELGCLSDYPEIKSVLWIGFPGNVGTTALAQILCGKVNPSGRLADTWLKDNFAAPASNNFQILKEDGSWDEKSYHLENYKDDQGYFLHYSENIYVGYRYFETRALTDKNYCYEKEVMWSFGYGLSYTRFEQTIERFEMKDQKIFLTICIKNVGHVSGKEVVQIYVNPPYSGKIEKSVTNLISFDKTGELQPQESTEINFEIPIEEMASFDSSEEKAYVLEAGRYEIALMKNAHEKIESRIWNLEESIVYRTDKDGARNSDRKEAIACFEEAAATGKDLTRSWDPESPAFCGPSAECYHASEKTLHSLEAKVMTDAAAGYTDKDYPGVGLKFPRKILWNDMKYVPYEDAKWDAFVSQMTVGEMSNLCGNGAWHTEAVKRLGIPKRLIPDGSTCICSTIFSGIVMSNAGEGIIYPNPVVLASTWNHRMGEAMGHAVGKEAKSLGYHGWYAPAVNCHRTHFNARNFEYYSEDGVLSGKIAAAVVRGSHKEGILCCLKHFVMNERESSGRKQLLTYCNEQAIREIYLKPFEIAVKEGGAKGIMTSFNYVGSVWAGANHALLEEVLRNEWGFQGMISTDACVYPHMDVKKMIATGGDLSLDSLGGFVGGNIKRVELLKAAKNKNTRVVITRNLQRASKNILYAFCAVENERQIDDND